MGLLRVGHECSHLGRTNEVVFHGVVFHEISIVRLLLPTSLGALCLCSAWSYHLPPWGRGECQVPADVLRDIFLGLIPLAGTRTLPQGCAIVFLQLLPSFCIPSLLWLAFEPAFWNAILWRSAFFMVQLPQTLGFPDSSVGKESACNAGSPGLIAWEGIGYALQYSWASLVALLVKNLPSMRETWVWSLGWEDPLEKGKATHSSILAWRIPRTI